MGKKMMGERGEYPRFKLLLNEHLRIQERSAKWLADKLALNASTVTKWLNEEARPGKADTVDKIAKILGLTQEQWQELLIAADYLDSTESYLRQHSAQEKTEVLPSLSEDNLGTSDRESEITHTAIPAIDTKEGSPVLVESFTAEESVKETSESSIKETGGEPSELITEDTSASEAKTKDAVIPSIETDNEAARELSNSEEIQKLMSEIKKEGFTIVLVGRAGVGKSSTINSLMGQEVVETGEFEATTKEVSLHPNDAYGVRYFVVDTPGLADGDESNDRQLLKTIQSKAPILDCILFVTPLNETRVRSDEKQSVRMITEVFGKEVWKHAVVVFTYANSVPLVPNLEIRTKLIRELIGSFAGEEIAVSLPSVAIDNCSPLRVDGTPWLGEFYMTVFRRISEHGKAAFVMATGSRIKSGKIPLKPEEKEEVLSWSWSGVLDKSIDVLDTLGRLPGALLIAPFKLIWYFLPGGTGDRDSAPRTPF